MEKDEDTLRLSAAFKEDGADLELVCHVINITYKEHRKILEECRPLRDYSFFVHRVNDNQKRGMTLDEAVREAIKYCIEHDVMKGFLEAHREEVLKMFALQWDADEEKKEDVAIHGSVDSAEGETKGKAEAARSLMETLNCTKEKAMELLKIPADMQKKVLALM